MCGRGTKSQPQRGNIEALLSTHYFVCYNYIKRVVMNWGATMTLQDSMRSVTLI